MNQTFFTPQTSRTPLVVVLTAITVLGGWLLAPESHSQAPAAVTSNVALNAVLTKLKSQQDAIAANQTKIEAQTALLKEDLRQAKIYAARVVRVTVETQPTIPGNFLST